MKHIKLYEDFNSEENMEESKKQIKRKYGEYSSISVYEKAVLRNSILLSVGNKSLTLENLKLLFNKVAEGRGKDLNGKKWYTENKKYFKESKGNYKLSNLGLKIYNRLLEMDYEEKLTKVTNKGAVNEVLDYNTKEAIEQMLDVALTYGGGNTYTSLDFTSLEDAYEGIIETIPSSKGKKSFTERVKDICNQLNLDCPY